MTALPAPPAPPPPEAPAPFPGFRRPSYTMVPDELFDELLPALSGAELKVLLFVVRRTFGFKRDADAISLAQMLRGVTTREGRVLHRGVGLSKPTLLGALRSLQERGVLRAARRRSATRGDEPTVYALRFAARNGQPDTAPAQHHEQPGPPTSPPPVVKKVAQGGGQESEPGGGKPLAHTTDRSQTHTETTSPPNPHSPGRAGRGPTGAHQRTNPGVQRRR